MLHILNLTQKSNEYSSQNAVLSFTIQVFGSDIFYNHNLFQFRLSSVFKRQEMFVYSRGFTSSAI